MSLKDALTDAILEGDFPGAMAEIDHLVGTIHIPVLEIVKSGGDEAQVTQRLRAELDQAGWKHWNFSVEKSIDGDTTYASSHEVDHVKRFDTGVIALEIEWNNKDPFYDRDLDNFHRLHADGAISVGIIVTRGSSFQGGVLGLVEDFAESNRIASVQDLEKYDLSPTRRQLRDISKAEKSGEVPFWKAWASRLVADKFASSTTHWDKLADRLDRGVGNPCPLVAIGIPLSSRPCAGVYLLSPPSARIATAELTGNAPAESAFGHLQKHSVCREAAQYRCGRHQPSVYAFHECAACSAPTYS